MLAVTAFYGLLALAALWACWRDPDLFWIAVWLVINCALSNAIQFALVMQAPDPLAAVGSLKPGPFTFVESMTAVAVFCAWTDHRFHSRWATRGLVSIIICNVLSICFNVALAAYSPPNVRQVFLYEVTTNMLFATECLLAFAVGVADGVRTGRFYSWLRTRRHVASPHAGCAESPPGA